jgi:hypothetical protein
MFTKKMLMADLQLFLKGRLRISCANIALVLSILVTCLWVLWGVIEMFHEGWYAPFEWLFFLLPAMAMLSLTLIALRLPRVGAALFIAIGVGLNGLVLWQFRPGGGRNADWTLINLLSWVPVTLLPVVIGLFDFLGRGQRRRRFHYLVAIGVPFLLGIVLAVEPAYRVSQRTNDGYLGERFIQGNGVTLHWAPDGPGWDRDGGVSWNEIALYSKGDIGFEGKRFGTDGSCNGSGDWARHCATEEEMRAYNVCLYLNQEGTQLMSTRQNAWRMPTTDEVVRSLVRHGENAGCAWHRSTGRPPCVVSPDKESPLWDPNIRLIYLWTAEEVGMGEAYFIAYHGDVGALWKFSAMGSRGYRCVQVAQESSDARD